MARTHTRMSLIARTALTTRTHHMHRHKETHTHEINVTLIFLCTSVAGTVQKSLDIFNSSELTSNPSLEITLIHIIRAQSIHLCILHGSGNGRDQTFQ